MVFHQGILARTYLPLFGRLTLNGLRYFRIALFFSEYGVSLRPSCLPVSCFVSWEFLLKLPFL